LPPPDPWNILPIHPAGHYLGIEAAVVALAFLFSLLGPFVRAAARVERAIAALSRRPALSFAALFVAFVALRLALLAVRPVPVPIFHDEFSYLLASDTFYHLRLTNPQPPFPQAFETIHVNLWPTYQSMYMPGTGLVLALGQFLGSPWFSVLATSALFCAVLYWTVSAYLPRPYALAAGMAAIGVAANLNYWFDSYFCMGIQAIGGALVLGSLPRILRARGWRSTLPLAAGLVLLMLTRPVEGAVLALPCVLLLIWQLRAAGAVRVAALAVLPLALVALTATWIGYYNWRGTGHATLTPYVANYTQYHVTGPFLFSPQRSVPAYRHESLRELYVDYEIARAQAYRQDPVEFFLLKAKVYYHTFIIGYGTPLLIGLIAVLRRRIDIAWAPALALCSLVVLSALMAWYPFPQYAAPTAAALFLLIACGIRSLRRWQWGPCSGVALSRGLIAAQLLLAVNVFYGHLTHDKMSGNEWLSTVERPRIAGILDDYPGQHICFVRYGPDHSPVEEWVYNSADPASQRIIWVRSIGAETDSRILAAFPGRTAWLLHPDRVVPQVERYTPGQGSAAPPLD
jgi:hypothetical protein